MGNSCKMTFLFSFIFGVFMAGYLDIYPGILVFVFFSVLILPVILKKYLYCFLALLFVAGCFTQVSYKNFMVQKSFALTENLTGVITEDVDQYDKSTYFIVKLDNGLKAHVKLKRSLHLYQGYRVALIDCKVSRVNIHNYISSMNTRLLGKNIFLSIEPANIEVLSFDNFYYTEYYGRVLREKCAALMQKHLSFDVAAVASAMLSGKDDEIDTSFYNHLIQSGTLHIVVVSGAHFVMIYNILFLFLTLFIKSRRLKLGIVIPFLLFYMFFTGSTITVVRSFIMTAVVLFSDLFYIKRTDSKIICLLTAAVFLAGTPTLVYNISFLLSFGAVLGIVLFQNKIKTLLRFIKYNNIKDFLCLSFSSQIFTVPLIYYFFARVSTVSLLSNFFVEYIISFILIVAILFVLLAPLGYFLGNAVAYLVNWSVKYFMMVVNFTSTLESKRFGSGNINIFTMMFMMGTALLVFYMLEAKMKKHKVIFGAFTGIFFFTTVVSFFVPMTNTLHVSFIGSDETNTALITTGQGETIFFGKAEDLYFYRNSSVLKTNAVIPLMIITEVNNEAYLKELMDIYSIRNFAAHKTLEQKLHWLPNIAFFEHLTNTNYKNIGININADENHLNEVMLSYAGHTLSLVNQINFTDYAGKTVILHPLDENNYENVNKNLVLFSKKYYNNGIVKQYNSYSLLTFGKKGIKLIQ